MMHSSTEVFVRSDGVGVGVRATAPLPAGTVLWVRDALDVALSPAAFTELPPALRKQVERLGYRDSRGQWIVCWDAGKFVNHCCEPTMRGVGHDAMIAVRDVAAGDEIFCDYAECNLEQPLQCECGASACRQQVSSAVAPEVWRQWQREVEGAVDRARHLAQPLAAVSVGEGLEAILAGGRPVPNLADVAIRPKV